MAIVAPPVVVDVYVLPPARPWYTDVWIRMLRRKPLGTLGGVIVLAMLLSAVFADVLTPYGFSQTNLRERFIAANGEHWLGTDQLGRDLLTRLLYGAGISESRIVRGVALSIKENTYIESPRALGSGHVRIALVHILPNVLPAIIVIATTGLSTVILTEASLSFLGLGVPPPYPTWGGMLSLAGLDHMYRAPWLAIWPAVALSLAVFGFNMLGDALRDLLDPRLKGG